VLTEIMPATAKHTKKGVLAAACLLLFCLLALREYSLQPDGKLHVTTLNVGQGDSILLQGPSGKNIVIDGGPDLSLLRSLGVYLPFFDRSIDLLVLTHPERDHVTAFPELLRRYDVQQVLLTGVQHDLGQYNALLHELRVQNIPLLLVSSPSALDLGDGMSLEILWPREVLLGKNIRARNDTSIVLRGLFGGRSVLLPGDMEEGVENALLSLGEMLRSDILKVPHHGSRTSSSTGFLLAVSPKVAIASVGNKNPYGHPHEEIVLRYERLGIPLSTTGTEGDISYVIDRNGKMER
jgi:competence protein ComEC